MANLKVLSAFELGESHPVVLLHPLLEEQGPDGELGKAGEILAHAGAVRAELEDVEFGGDTGSLYSVVVSVALSELTVWSAVVE